MKVLVPNNLNVPELIEELNLSNRRQKYVKEKIYHLISRVVATHKNIKKFEKMKISVTLGRGRFGPDIARGQFWSKTAAAKRAQLFV